MIPLQIVLLVPISDLLQKPVTVQVDTITLLETQYVNNVDQNVSLVLMKPELVKLVLNSESTHPFVNVNTECMKISMENVNYVLNIVYLVLLPKSVMNVILLNTLN
jgi:invasion protein IalB